MRNLIEPFFGVDGYHFGGDDRKLLEIISPFIDGDKTPLGRVRKNFLEYDNKNPLRDIIKFFEWCNKIFWA